MPQITTRPGTADDARTVAQLVAALTTEICERSGMPPLPVNVPETAQTCKELVEQGHYRTLLALADDQPIGVATMCESYALYAGGKIGVVEEFYVAPEWRSQLVGETLIGEVRKLGAARGWKAIELTTPPLPAFDRTIAFYEKCGFAVSGGRRMRRWTS